MPAARRAERRDWTPENRAELCACIAWMARAGKLTAEDEQHVADYIAFRAARAGGEHASR